MSITRRIFISSPRDEHVDDIRKEVKWAIIEEIEKLGYEAQVFGSEEGGRGLASGISWDPQEADRVMRRCVGAAILGFPIWSGTTLKTKKRAALVSEYCHYEGALARAYQLPILSILEEGLDQRVFFVRYGGDAMIRVPASTGRNWVSESQFQKFLQGWNARLARRRDLFLAYSGKAEDTAQKVKEMLTALGASILDWKTDFAPGPTILQQIEDAVKRTSGGIFLFTSDDILSGGAGPQAAPRDNVIFEAGVFANSKGHKRVLIILEKDAKMPADLGGIVYAGLTDRHNIEGIQDQLKQFLKSAL